MGTGALHQGGERTLERLAEEVQAEAGAATEIMCFRCNVEYSGTGSTWGCHESYLHRADPASLPEQLIPHLVTRVIYSGAGGFNPLVNWPEFCVAPRLLHIQRAISGDSTGNRGIFHTKNESLSGDGYNRLHILCGESLCSETAIVLKIGATALVTAMAEEGLKPGAGLRLESPIEALHAVSSDVTCKRKLKLARGGEATAIEIQRRLLELAERNREVLPPWADGICALWRLTLGQLEGAPDSVATVLDWAIKHRLFQDRAARRGISVQRSAFLSSIIQRLNAALADIGVKSRGVRLSSLLAPESPVPQQVARIEKDLAAEKLSWDDLDHFLNLRDELYQIDTRFGQIGPRGIFTELDRRGVLDHKVAAIDQVEVAMDEPPALGRARLRGEAIRRLSGQGQAVCGWMSVTGPDGRKLDLSDPFAAVEVWSGPTAPPDDEGAPPHLAGDLASDIPTRPEGTHDFIAQRAYQLWQARGRPRGSPEVDWLEAVRELRGGEPAGDPPGDSGRLHQMRIALRGRYDRLRTRAQGPPETTQGPHR